MARRLLPTALVLLALAGGNVARTATKRPVPDGGGGGYLVARVKAGDAIALRRRPFGKILGWVHARTEFGSAQALPVVRRRGNRWLGVVSTSLRNGRVAWVDANAGALSFDRVPMALEVNRSRRLLRVWVRGRGIVRRIRVAVGRPGSPTPLGRFSVTDKLPGAEFGSYFGCCILALSGHQTNLPRGWRGGDRLAIHGSLSRDEGSASSAGCLHASAHDLRYLMRIVPLGTQVVIHA
ncbi:MAG: L,D-transpeptidase [Gaiellaceae bacterium]